MPCQLRGHSRSDTQKVPLEGLREIVFAELDYQPALSGIQLDRRRSSRSRNVNLLSYPTFKLHGWVYASPVPERGQEATRDYYGGYQNKYGHRPYDVSKDFYGDSLQNRVKYITVARDKVEPGYYVIIR
jgi:hypothetical protein